jgi:hypothetical protein
LFGAKNVSGSSEYLITGYCGSELFRALHIQGAITSSELVNVFKKIKDKELIDSLWNSEKLIFLRKEKYTDEFQELVDEVLLFRKNRPKEITDNQFFYYFIFTEVFRKIFGSWTAAQFSEMHVRVPFLDYAFIQELLKTDLAGINNDFFIHNPFKRYKGQLLYAEIIRQSSPEMFKLYTGKGYRPSDMMSFRGKINIVLPYINKKLNRKIKPLNLDNLGLISGYNAHRSQIENTFYALPDFDIPKLLEMSAKLNKYTREVIRDRIFQSASLASIY